MSTSDLTSVCPKCQIHGPSYKLIHEPRLEYEDTLGEHVDFLPTLRDYECRNCGAAWLLLENDA